MPEIPKAPPSQISSEALDRIFKKSDLIEEFYFPPEVPKPPSCFEEEKHTDKDSTQKKEKS